MSLPLHLRAYQEPTRDDLTRLLFNVPPLLWVMPQASPSYDPATDPKLVKDPRHEQAMKEKMESGGVGMMNGTMGMEISAILSVEGKDEVYSGKLHLLPPFLCFMSLDKRSARFSLPLYTIRRVERLNSRAGVFALSLATWHGLRIILQLTSLLPTAEHFSILLRDALKAQLSEMKLLKPFLPTLYSEYLLTQPAFLNNQPLGMNTPAEEKVDLINLGSDLGGGGREKSTNANPNAPAADARGPGGDGKGAYERGLGETFGYPGDARKLRERSKIKLWREYFVTHGRNLTLLRYPPFQRLLQVGLPSRLRGELWETLSGSLYLRYANRSTYSRLLAENANRTTSATDEIEKDLNRSLPEYKAYQSEEGLSKLRRVLVAYSFRNPELGYCQALNIVVAGLLIYMSEEQAFWLLEVLCDRIVPGYYTPSMEGTLLDQRVFEALVGRCLPMIHQHFKSVDVQISVASLPWFLSLYINSMPLIFAFRVVDCVMAMGVKVIFQIGLAVLKINGEELLEITDDGMFINAMRSYFATLGDSAHPDHSDPRVRAITNFQELLVVAFREFNVITEETIQSERKRFRAIIADEIEMFSKRAAVRNLKFTGRFNKEQVTTIYDKFFAAVSSPLVMSVNPSPKATPPVTPGSAQDSAGRLETRIDLKTFKLFLSDICSWARDEIVYQNAFSNRTEKKVAEHELVERLYFSWDTSHQGYLSLQDVVAGLDTVMFAGLMESIEWFFHLHDKNKDGFLTKDEVIQLSESLLFIFRNEPGDAYLAAVSKFILNAFDFGDATAPEESLQPDHADEEVPTAGDDHNATQNRKRAESVSSPHNAPYLNLATFRMVILADELLEGFFDSDLAASFRLDAVPGEYHVTQAKSDTLIGGLVNMVVTNENKSRFNRFADGLGSALGRHAEWRKPAIGKSDPVHITSDVQTRESLLNPAQQEVQRLRSPSSASSATMTSTASQMPSRIRAPSTSSTMDNKRKDEADMLRAAQEAIMHRPNFAIDAIGDTDEDAPGGEDEEGVMDEVEAFLKANDTDEKGLTGEAKATANDLLTAEPIR
ncbi:putative GTPase-activating protein [Filobasidium floriforme]|uniref:putative GTPase-activating protein n=1 Tax=Filobasidium floriforme TaxID=5210 RepID=UPI001E8D6EA4|nr:putative GTPase-activating protein [Filobasidium floriforme]KAH8089610.1 putative GTPase-activating protein [Filobasidium floriforme]